MRRDTVELVRKAVAEIRRAYVLVNNRSEGNAPLTVQALAGVHCSGQRLWNSQRKMGRMPVS